MEKVGKMRWLISIGLLFLSINLQAGKPVTKWSVIFIGNSITQGVILENPASEAPPVCAVRYLEQYGYTVAYANCGFSGSTTVDFLPGNGQYFRTITNAADTLCEKGTPLIFSIMLGTNDSAIQGPNGSPVSPDQYRKNLEQIIDSLHARYPGSRFILHQPIWYSPNTHNSSSYLEEGLKRLQSYTPQLDALVKSHPAYISKGDRDAFDFFRKRSKEYLIPENGQAGIFYLHPNAAGAEKLGEYWAKNLKNYMKIIK